VKEKKEEKFHSHCHYERICRLDFCLTLLSSVSSVRVTLPLARKSLRVERFTRVVTKGHTCENWHRSPYAYVTPVREREPMANARITERGKTGIMWKIANGQKR